MIFDTGSYEIESTQPRVILFRNQNGHENAVAVAATTSGSTARAKKLVFNRYGDQYFLSKTIAADGEDEMTFVPSKLEKSVRAEEASLKTEGETLIALK